MITVLVLQYFWIPPNSALMTVLPAKKWLPGKVLLGLGVKEVVGGGGGGGGGGGNSSKRFSAYLIVLPLREDQEIRHTPESPKE